MEQLVQRALTAARGQCHGQGRSWKKKLVGVFRDFNWATLFLSCTAQWHARYCFTTAWACSLTLLLRRGNAECTRWVTAWKCLHAIFFGMWLNHVWLNFMQITIFNQCDCTQIPALGTPLMVYGGHSLRTGTIVWQNHSAYRNHCVQWP